MQARCSCTCLTRTPAYTNPAVAPALNPHLTHTTPPQARCSCTCPTPTPAPTACSAAPSPRGRWWSSRGVWGWCASTGSTGRSTSECGRCVRRAAQQGQVSPLCPHAAHARPAVGTARCKLVYRYRKLFVKSLPQPPVPHATMWAPNLTCDPNPTAPTLPRPHPLNFPPSPSERLLLVLVHPRA